MIHNQPLTALLPGTLAVTFMQMIENAKLFSEPLTVAIQLTIGILTIVYLIKKIKSKSL